jgi:predicted membrane protein DUF2306
MLAVVALLIGIVVVFAAIRLSVDVPHLLASTLPEEAYDRRFVEHAWPAYLHLAPGIVYLLVAPFQLSYRIRSRHYTAHRRTGRVLVSLALLSGVFAMIFGVRHAFGGRGEALASLVFGTWFLACLVLAFRAVRRGDIVHHRRWMIRAFATAVGVGTIRIWIGVFQATGLYSFQESFAPAFWIALTLHALAAEWWLRTTPHPDG